MLRLACILGVERGVKICAPVHDAILIEAPVDELDHAIATMQEAMRDASRVILNGFELGTDAFYQALDGSELANEPPGSGGLLVALHQLRLLLTKGESAFSEYYYLGSEPLDLTGQPVDVLVTTVSGVETRWYFSRQPASLIGFSTQLAEDVDECEVFFMTLRETDGRFFPNKILVRSGARDYLRLEVESFSVKDAGK